MQDIREMLAGALPEQANSPNTEPLSHEQIIQRAVDRYNTTPGSLEGYDCADCLNRGDIAVALDGEEIHRECSCMATRLSIWRIERSGLKSAISRMSFENYRTDEPWQKTAKNLAVAFVENREQSWFYAGGQPGSGKTHLCTAIFGYLLKKGIDARYMPWREGSVSLKAMVTDDMSYRDMITPIKTAPLLYIDDFLKCAAGKVPSPADIGLAFEIINYRYNNPHLATIISSEYDIDNIMVFDEATGSRIYERSKNFCLIISRGERFNKRLCGSEQEREIVRRNQRYREDV